MGRSVLARWAIVAVVLGSTARPVGAEPSVIPDTSRAIRAAADSESTQPRAKLERIERAVAADTIGLHAQIGMRADATNESYYEDGFVDTTFLGRRLVDTPEERYAGVLSTILAGTRDARVTRYRLQSEVSIGDRLEREYAGLSWRSILGPDWTWWLDPNGEHRRDRTFGRDLEEWRAALGARARRRLADDLTAAELGVRGELLRASGQGSEFHLDRNAVSFSSALDHLGLVGDEWRVGYRLSSRFFPHSTERDHVEHQWEARWKAVVPGGRWLAFDAAATRRVTVRVVPTSRDNFWVGNAAVEGRGDLDGSWGMGAGIEAEVTHYDLEDSTFFFDYQVARGRLGLRYEPRVQWVVEIGPRAEALFARLNPGEEYREWSGVLDLEFLGRGSWWNATPAAGWREYEDVASAGPGTPPLHSSYAFYGLDLTADQQLPAGLRFKAITALRWEYHVDPAQDARSLYASVELSRALQ